MIPGPKCSSKLTYPKHLQAPRSALFPVQDTPNRLEWGGAPLASLGFSGFRRRSGRQG